MAEEYVRARDDPFFDGMRRGDSAVVVRSKGSGLDISRNHDITRSVSDVGIQVELSERDAVPNSPFRRSSSVVSSETTCVTKTISVSNIPRPLSAALFYSGNSRQTMEFNMGSGIERLNKFLKATRDEVSAGIPSRFLQAVISPDVASTIMYAFYLNETLNDDYLCTVPVINMKRSDLHSHHTWLLDSCFVHQSSIIFIDDIDLSYYDLYGSLKLVLLNGSKFPPNQEALKDAVVDIFNCKSSCCTFIAEKFALTSPEILTGRGFSRLLLAGILIDTANLTNPSTTTKDKYMTTLLLNGAGRFGCNGLYQILAGGVDAAHDPKAGQVLPKDVERLDAAEVSNREISHKDAKRISKSEKVDTGKVLPKDTKTLSKSDAGEVTALPKHTAAELRAGEVLLKDPKKWSKSGVIGMSSVGISIREVVSHHSTSAENIKGFQQQQKLGLLLIVSGYYDKHNNFKREILISAESGELMKSLLHFLYSYSNVLPLKALRQSGLAAHMRVFQMEKIVSRKTVEKLLQEFNDLGSKLM